VEESAQATEGKESSISEEVTSLRHEVRSVTHELNKPESVTCVPREEESDIEESDIDFPSSSDFEEVEDTASTASSEATEALTDLHEVRSEVAELRDMFTDVREVAETAKDLAMTNQEVSGRDERPGSSKDEAGDDTKIVSEKIVSRISQDVRDLKLELHCLKDELTKLQSRSGIRIESESRIETREVHLRLVSEVDTIRESCDSAHEAKSNVESLRDELEKVKKLSEEAKEVSESSVHAIESIVGDSVISREELQQMKEVRESVRRFCELREQKDRFPVVGDEAEEGEKTEPEIAKRVGCPGSEDKKLKQENWREAIETELVPMREEMSRSGAVLEAIQSEMLAIRQYLERERAVASETQNSLAAFRDQMLTIRQCLERERVTGGMAISG
jgi:hypothetical protein